MLKAEDVIFSGSKLDDIDLPRIGHQIGIGEDLVHGLLDTETAGKSTDSKGRLKMLYEPHVAYRCAPNKTIRDKLVKAGLAYPKWGTKSYPKESYTRFWKAYAIDPDTAIKACSWGGPQILGENYALAGFDTPEAMVKAMASDEDQQLQAMINFVNNSGLDDELQVLQAKLDRGEKLTGADCVPFVRGYNGKGYAKNDYHNKFAKNVNKWAKIPDTPWSPDTPREANLYDGKVHEELKAVQTTLDEIGYPEVGAIDGRWGNRTAAAVLAFRLDNKLQTSDPRIDAEFLTTLALKPQRPVSDARKNAYDKKMATAYAKWSRRKIEAESEIIPVPLPAFVATKTIIARVQSQLHDKGYTEVGSRRADGSFDGVKGNMTDAAILLAKEENGFLPLDADISPEFLAALPGFPNRKLADERANATPADVAAKVPEARANWWGQAMNAVAGFFSTIAAALFGVFQYFGVAKETVDQLKEYAADIPGEVWLGMIGVIALGMALLHRYGLNSSTEAFKKAERR